ncbi:hypothetical protein EVU94_07280 [Flavobacteriaceae bacterium 144Ye]|nr:hypothetical protein EVU94_07280 [Flavobacteriaceae bacterium 144Ye]
MQKPKTLIALLAVLSVVFLGLQLFKYEYYASGIRALLLVLLSILYCSRVEDKRKFFFLFLITFTVADVFNFLSWQISPDNFMVDYSYYIINAMYIISYTFLIIQILKTLDIKEVIAKLPVHIIILLVLDISCVIVVTNTTKPELQFAEYLLEFVYNIVIMALLSVALINYIYKDDKKSMNFLVGSIFIVFSEVIQLAYFYVSEVNVLNVLCSIFLVLAFLFFYLQAKIGPEENYNKLEV